MFEYKFYTNNKGQKVVLCLTSYRGKTVKGKAVCVPEDNYDEEFGKELARKRCEIEYYRRRVRDTYSYKEQLNYEIRKAKSNFNKADDIFRKSCLRYMDAVEGLKKIEDSIK